VVDQIGKVTTGKIDEGQIDTKRPGCDSCTKDSLGGLPELINGVPQKKKVGTEKEKTCAQTSNKSTQRKRSQVIWKQKKKPAKVPVSKKKGK